MERKNVVIPEADLARQREFEHKIKEMFTLREAHPVACVDTFGCQQNVADGQKLMGMLADCGFTSARAIICKVSRQLHLPAWLMYPLIRLGARLFGGFDLEEKSAIDAVKRIRVPVIFAHGETDTLVPSYMSRENYEACSAPKEIYIVADAGHGLCYLKAGEDYIKALRDFWNAQGIYGKVTIS